VAPHVRTQGELDEQAPFLVRALSDQLAPPRSGLRRITHSPARAAGAGQAEGFGRVPRGTGRDPAETLSEIGLSRQNPQPNGLVGSGVCANRAGVWMSARARGHADRKGLRRVY